MEDNQSFERLKNLDLSRDEINKLGDALKKDEFRKLLIDYVKEVQDPGNIKLYEQEITQLEKERGNDIIFLHPTPYYVIKTSLNGSKKCFINICGNELLKKPSSAPSEKEGARGLQWSLPHSMSPPSEDLDNKGERCKVFDVLFHPDTLHLAHKNKAFRDMVNITACNAIESHFDVKLDKNNLKFPKLKYKGIARASIIRKPSKEGPIDRTPEEKEFFDKIYAQADESTQCYKKLKKNKKSLNKNDICHDNSTYTTPKYLIKHRRHVELEEFTEHKGSKLNSTVPRELVIEVSLPLLKSAAEIVLDITQKTVQLTSEKPAKYKLNLTLPYEVDQDRGNAKFEKDLRKLVITLPVQRKFNLFDFAREDSGVDSDHGSPTRMESEEEFSENKNKDETYCDSKVKSDSQFRTKFLDEDIHYTVPEFTCHVFDGTIAFTLNVKHVDADSVAKLIDENAKSVQVKFVSISPSFYPFHCAFMVKLPVESIDKDSVSLEVWDNNVVLQISFKNCDNDCSSYMYGLSEDDLQQNYVEEPHVINALHEQNLLKADREEFETTQELGDTVSISKNSNHNSNDEENSSERNLGQSEISMEESNDIEDHSLKHNLGTSYESSGDELSCSFSPCKSRGILKRTANRKFSRSISESSLDDCFGSLDYEGIDSAIPEDHEPEEEISTSLKKTVRFNDVVSKQLYRFNSSILGQKKKNQRKAQKKKKAHERRHSESEASEVEDKKEREPETHNECDLRTDNNNSEMSTKIGDEHIFHLDM